MHESPAGSRRTWSRSAFACAVIACVASCHSTPKDTGAHARPDPSPSPLASTLRTPVARGASQRALAKRSVESFRKSLKPTQTDEAPAAPVVVPAPLVDEVRAAMSARDLPRAAEAVVALLRTYPKSVEAREALVCVQYLQRNPEGAKQALDELRAVAPASPLLLALDGLDALRQAEPARAVESLSWFVGVDALPLSTCFGSLPVESGRVEESLMNALLALGATEAAATTAQALLATDVAASGDGALHRAAMRARLFLGDLSMARSSRADAVEAWSTVAAGNGFEAEIARWRLARSVLHSDRLADEECRRILVDPQALLRDEPAMLRLSLIASHADATATFSSAGGRAAELAASLPESLRMQCIAANLGDQSARARVRGQAPRAWNSDPFAYRLAVSSAALVSAMDAVEIARVTVAQDAASLQAAADALAWSGVPMRELHSVLEPALDAPSQALWSALLCAFGLAEDGFEAMNRMDASPAHAPWKFASQLIAAGYLRDASLVDAAVRALEREPTLALSLASLALEAQHRALDPLASLGTADRAASALEEAMADEMDSQRKALLVDAARVRLETGSGGATDREFLRAEVLSHGRSAEEAWVVLSGLRGEGSNLCPPPPSIALQAVVAADALAVVDSPLTGELLTLAAECSTDGLAIARLWSRADAGDEWASRALSELAQLHPVDGRLARASSAAAQAIAGSLDARRTLRLRETTDLSAFPRPQTAAFEIAAAERAHAVSNDAEAVSRLRAALSDSQSIDALLVRAFALLIEMSAEESPNKEASSLLLDEVAERLIASTEPIAPLWAVALFDTKSGGAGSGSSNDPAAMQALASSLSSRVTLGSQGSVQCFLLSGRLLAREEPELAAEFTHAMCERAIAQPAIRALVARHAVALDALSGGREEETLRGLSAMRALGVEPYLRESEITAGTKISEAESMHRASGTYSLLGNDAGAAAITDAALRIDPNHAGSLNNRAYAALDRGVLDAESERAATRAAELAPDNPSFLDTLGLLRYRKGELADGPSGLGAITLFRTALRLAPRDPSIITLLHLGDALWLSGDQAGAVKCWQQIGQVAALRYPPREIAQSLAMLQQTQFGMQFLDPTEFLQREYGATVSASEHRLQAVARGVAPQIGVSQADAARKVQVDETH